jgi:hypothetical protein
MVEHELRLLVLLERPNNGEAGRGEFIKVEDI